jgi:hypothetical protein
VPDAWLDRIPPQAAGFVPVLIYGLAGKSDAYLTPVRADLRSAARAIDALIEACVDEADRGCVTFRLGDRA